MEGRSTKEGGENTAIELDEREKVVFCKLCEVTKAKAAHLTGDYFLGIIEPKNNEEWAVVDSLETHKKLVEHWTEDCLLRLTPKGYDLCKKFCGQSEEISRPVEISRTEGSIGIRRT